MTKSAKRGTAKAPAETAVTAPAATSGDAEPEAAAEPTDAAGAGPGQAGTAEASPGQSGTGQSGTGDAAETDLEETKRKFREALERKHQSHTDGQGKGSRDGGKISGAHGPAASRRNFRRKSG